MTEVQSSDFDRHLDLARSSGARLHVPHLLRPRPGRVPRLQ